MTDPAASNRQVALHEAAALYAEVIPTGWRIDTERVLALAAAFEEWLDRDDTEENPDG